MNKLIYSLGVAAVATVILAACGDDDDSTGGLNQGQAGARVYNASLAPVNSGQTASGAASGSSSLRIQGDTVEITATGTGIDPSASLAGFLYKGTECPTAAADTNSDGIIDAAEGSAVYGPALVPFATDISSLATAATSGGAPTATAEGNFNFRGTGSLNTLVSGLRARPATGVVGNLGADEEFNPENTIVVIHGVNSATGLPDSVATAAGLSAQQSLPILCGRYVLVSPTPSPSASPAASPDASGVSDDGTADQGSGDVATGDGV